MEKGEKPSKRFSEKDQIQNLEKKLKELERQNREMIETNLYGMHEIDIYGKIVYINSIMRKLVGYTADDFNIKEIWDLLADDTEKSNLTNHLTLITRDKDVSNQWTGTYLTKNEKKIKLKSNWNCRRDDQGHVIGFIAVTTHADGYETTYQPVEDSSSDEMDKTQSWMVGKEVNYQRIIENARELIMIFNLKGNITFINEGGIDIIGYFEEELIEMNITDFVPADQLHNVKEILVKNRKEKKRELVLFNTEIINRSLKLVPIELSISLMERYGAPTDILLIGRELSKRPVKEG